MTQLELIGISYSPWTEKARWVLDHHRLPYRYTEHLIMLGVPQLRWKMRSLSSDLTVPALIDGSTRLCDSFAIARYVDSKGLRRPKLCLEGRETELEAINRLSEVALDAARGLVVGCLGKSREASKESLPSFVPAALRGGLLWLVKLGLSYVDHEFSIGAKGPDVRRADLKQALIGLREALARSERGYLLGSFSLADIAGAVALQPVRPVADSYIGLGTATRLCWTNEDLAREFSDLVEWRDEIYAKHRAGTLS